MQTFRTAITVALTGLFAISTAGAAEERHAVSASAIAQAVTHHVAEQDTDRAAIREALGRPEVQQVANRLGVDVAQLTASVDALNADTLACASTQAQQVNQALVGGASTITISTTTIVIVLLVLILIIVA